MPTVPEVEDSELFLIEKHTPSIKPDIKSFTMTDCFEALQAHDKPPPKVLLDMMLSRFGRNIGAASAVGGCSNHEIFRGGGNEPSQKNGEKLPHARAACFGGEGLLNSAGPLLFIYQGDPESGAVSRAVQNRGSG
jgi:hypothetical protein